MIKRAIFQNLCSILVSTFSTRRNLHFSGPPVRSIKSLIQRNTSEDTYEHFGGKRDNFFLKRGLAFLGFSGATFGLYYVSHLDYAPYTNRRRMIDLSRRDEKRLGEVWQQQFLQADQPKILPDDHIASRLVQKVGWRIAKVANQQDFQWEFHVIHDPNVVNAVCLPGGKVIVYSGIMREAATNETALAAVLAHEIGHAVARHHVEKMAFAKVLLLLQIAMNFLFQTHVMSTLIINLFGNLPYSRTLEIEADIIGLTLMAEACYDPREAPRMFERLGEVEKKQGVNVPKYLSTHPTNETRIKNLEKQLPEALTKYSEKCRVHQKYSATNIY